MTERFHKMHGLGNDFVIIDGREEAVTMSPELARGIADRHRGVGCDQVIVIGKSEVADVSMHIWNHDGGEVGPPPAEPLDEPAPVHRREPEVRHDDVGEGAGGDGRPQHREGLLGLRVDAGSNGLAHLCQARLGGGGRHAVEVRDHGTTAIQL